MEELFVIVMKTWLPHLACMTRKKVGEWESVTYTVEDEGEAREHITAMRHMVTGMSHADIDLHMRLRHRKMGHCKLCFKFEVGLLQAKWIHALVSVLICLAMRLHGFTNWEICFFPGPLESGVNLSFWKQFQRNKSVPVLRCLKILIWLRLLRFCQENVSEETTRLRSNGDYLAAITNGTFIICRDNG